MYLRNLKFHILIFSRMQKFPKMLMLIIYVDRREIFVNVVYLWPALPACHTTHSSPVSLLMMYIPSLKNSPPLYRGLRLSLVPTEPNLYKVWWRREPPGSDQTVPATVNPQILLQSTLTPEFEHRTIFTEVFVGRMFSALVLCCVLNLDPSSSGDNTQYGAQIDQLTNSREVLLFVILRRQHLLGVEGGRETSGRRVDKREKGRLGGEGYTRGRWVD